MTAKRVASARKPPDLEELLESAAYRIDDAAEITNLCLVAARTRPATLCGQVAAIENVLRELRPLARRLRTIAENLPGGKP